MRPGTTVAAVLTGAALAALIVACGGVARKSAAPVAVERTAVDPGGAGLPASPREQIEALITDTDTTLARLGVERPPPYFPGTPEDLRPLADVRAVCEAPPHPGETCQAVCDLGDHVCKNSEQICEIAAELAPDTWAAGKCQDGKKACEAARQRCCGCT